MESNDQNSSPSGHNQLQPFTHFDLPPGFRFVPKDEELIIHYLKDKINGRPAKPYNCFSTVNVYGSSPQQLTENNPNIDGAWYFYTSRKRKYPNGRRPNRVAGDGYWFTKKATERIYQDDVFIGTKCDLVFCKGMPRKGKKTDWHMTEYKTDQPSIQPGNSDDKMLLDRCVLCRIFKTSAELSNSEKEATASKSRKRAK